MSHAHVPGPPEEAPSEHEEAGHPQATDQEVAHGSDGAVPEGQVEADRAHQERQARRDEG